MSNETTDVTDPGAPAPGSVTSRSSAKPWKKRLRRGVGPTLAMTPFFVYVFLGLGIPTIALINLAFRNHQGKLTTANIHLVSHGVFLSGLENSIRLAVISSIVPGVLGVFLAYAVHTSRSNIGRRLIATASGVLANFGGINLAFIFISALGTTGLLTVWLNDVHVNPYSHGFSIYTFYGVAAVYMYFQLPLMMLVITPALAGLRPSWREAASNMGASSWRYWRHVGVPVLMPSVLGGMLLLFGSAFAAYATAAALTGGIIALTPIQIGNFLNGNVIAGQENVGYALGLAMLVVLAITMILYGLVRRRASRWLQ